MTVLQKIALVGVAIALCGAAAAGQGTSGTVALNIEAQAIRTALEAFASQTGLQVVMREEDVGIEGLKAPRLEGSYSPEAALKLLLADSGLREEWINERTVAIRPMQNGTRKPIAAETDYAVTAVHLAQSDSATRNSNVNQAAGALPSSAQQFGQNAKQEPGKIEEIVVTAQKKLERLQDVPVPVAAINAEALARSNQLRLKDYYAKVPGLTLVQTGYGSEPIVAIRGITTGNAGYPTVGIVVDDVPYGASVLLGASVPDFDPGDLARVEVLRGPQGTLYGAASMGGLLKFVTIDPSTDALSGRLQAGFESVRYGSDPGHSLRGSVNIPLGSTLAMRASGFTLRNAGNVDNVFTGQRDVNRRDSEGGRLSVLWRPSDDFSLKLGATVQNSDRDGTEDVDTSLPGKFQQSSLRGTGIYNRQSEIYSAVMTARLSAVELTSVSGYNIDEMQTNADASVPWGTFFAEPQYGVSGVQQPDVQRNTKFTQELRASIPLGDRVRWLVGAFYTQEDFDSNFAFLPTDTTTGAGVVSSLSEFWLSSQATDFEERSLFTNLTFDITDRLDIQVGGRLTEGKQTFSNIRRGSLAAAFLGSDPSILPPTDSSDTAFTYLLTPRFRISPDLMLYARLASGYRPGGPNSTCGFPGVPCEFDPDTTRNYELGIKGALFDRALSVDASVYHIDWSDIQLSLVVNDFFYTGNASRAKSQGTEVSMEFKSQSGLTVSGWVAWNAAELAESFPPPPASSVRGRAGDRLPFSSRFSGNLALDREFPLGNSMTANVGGSLSYIGDRPGIFQTTIVRENFPAYAQADLYAGLQYRSWELNAFVTNVTDKRGILRSGLDAYRPTYFTYIQPRTIGLGISRTW